MPPDLRKRLLAILAADVAGYSRLMGQNDQATVSMLDAARSVFRHQIAAHGGRVVDMAGDSVLAVFETTAGAMAAAETVQRTLAASFADVPPEFRLQFRIGIHAGDVIEKPDGSIYGDNVNIAARLEALAAPGGIAVSQSVHGLVAGATDSLFEDIGEQSVKNIAQPVRAYRARVRADGAASATRAMADVTLRQLPGNLPESTSTLVSREGDLAALSGLVRTHRLVTLVGAGGIGKTRLAVALAHALRPAFRDGAWLVELAPLTEPALVAGAVAQALQIVLTGRKPAHEEVLEALKGRAMLVVLDNCEHLLDGVTTFTSALLARNAGIRLLATSQEVLHVPGENVYRLETLAVPPHAELPGARAFGAVTLFEERARSLRAQFALDEHNISDVIAICAALDGLPLAIELAAARVPLLGTSGIRQHLDDRFRLLTRGSHIAERRHQTLYAALDWSHDLLGGNERAVFRRIGVFSGGFTLAAAQHVAGGDGRDSWSVLDLLGALSDKSLLIADDSEPRRYRLLESAREFALVQLAQAREDDDARDRHAAFYLAEAQAAEAHLTAAERQVWLKRLRDESSNLRAALAWLVRERKHARFALGLAGSLAWFAYFEGLFQEWKQWLADALALPAAEQYPRERAVALSGAARLAAYSGEAIRAQVLADESIRLWRELGDRRGLAYALFHAGIARLVASQPVQAEAALRESLATFRSLDDPWGIALGSSYLGTAYALVPGAEDEARPLLLEGRAKFRALGDDWGASVSSHYLGSIALRAGDYSIARDLTLEMLVNARALGDNYRISRNLHQLAEIDVAQEQFVSAARQLQQSLNLTCQQGRAGDASQQWRLMASIAFRLGDSDGAAKLAGAAGRHAGGDRTMPADDPRVHAELLSTLRNQLGAGRFDDLFAAGSALTLEQASELASTVVARLG